MENENLREINELSKEVIDSSLEVTPVEQPQTMENKERKGQDVSASMGSICVCARSIMCPSH